MKKINGFILLNLFVNTILLLSLVSYHFSDTFYPYHIRNFIGLVGAKVSFFILNRFGIIGFALPIFFSLSSFSYAKHPLKFIRSITFTVLFAVAFDIVLYAAVGAERNHLVSIGYFACGSIGFMIGRSIEFLLGKIGTFLILLPISAAILYLAQKEFLLFIAERIKQNRSQDNSKKKEKQPAETQNPPTINPQTANNIKDNKADSLEQKEDSSQTKELDNKSDLENYSNEDSINIEYIEDEDSKPQAIINNKDEDYLFPPVELLKTPEYSNGIINPKEITESARKLEEKLKHFGVEGKVVNVRPGPVVTMYEFRPKSGIKISKIANLYNDLALAMEAMSVRIIAPIPGKAAIGIEISNKNREIVYMRDIISSKAFINASSKLTLGLGKDTVGNVFIADLTKMPHLLIAGATGSGKSVSINTMIISILYKARPDEVKFVMIDPKILELSIYDGIPHMMMPVVTDPKEAAAALSALINEMETRYKIMSEAGVRNIEGFNKKAKAGQIDYPPMPYIVVVIDELADLMMVSGKKVEVYIERLAQKARASGIHLIVATQRPSVDVITGLIKANFPARISFKVTSKVDSRTILDTQGAEALLGKGDMLLMQPGASSLVRIHGAFIDDNEIKAVTDFVKAQGSPDYNEELIEATKEVVKEDDDEELDPLFDEAVQIIKEGGNPSISFLQRKLKIGYNKAARIVEQMEKKGILSKPDHRGKREILI
ncbi:FtsK/SpoIIIE family DNA translocase [Hippea jasoniae]|uniref:FtsK/SpoIIIE family DNA translocase n=1 Tax=Hippea jasoniae TaxID=944479 RepID=UPI000559817B|nr:DNA translocase FtsK 4TM domain-containing protein [Hippea jasoniae]